MSASSSIIRIRSSCGLWRYDISAGETVAQLLERFRQDVLSKAQIQAEPLSFSLSLSDSPAAASLAASSPVLSLIQERGQIFYARFRASEGSQVVTTSQRSAARPNKVPRKVTRCPQHGPEDTCLSCVIANRINIKNFTREAATFVADGAVSFSGNCSDVFASYPHLFAYTSNRIGILYGRFEDVHATASSVPSSSSSSSPSSSTSASTSTTSTPMLWTDSPPPIARWRARVEFIYEPPQLCDADGFSLPETDARAAMEEEHLKLIADIFGLIPVGIIVSRRALDPDQLVTAQELMLLGKLWNPSSPHSMCFALSCPSEQGPPIVQAYEVARQFLELHSQALWEPPTERGRLLANEDVYVNVEYLRTVETGFFVLPTSVARHKDGYFTDRFLVENRNEPQLRKEVAKMFRGSNQSINIFKDFHLLLFISRDVEQDLAVDIIASLLAHQSLDSDCIKKINSLC